MAKGIETDYILVSLRHVEEFAGLSPMEAKVLLLLLHNVEKNNEVRTGKYYREVIADAINFHAEEGQRKTSPESIRFTIANLCKKNFLTKLSTGFHKLNPSIFFKE